MSNATIPSAVREYLSAIGSKGGKARVLKGPGALAPERRVEIAKKAAAARWANKKTVDMQTGLKHTETVHE